MTPAELRRRLIADGWIQLPDCGGLELWQLGPAIVPIPPGDTVPEEIVLAVEAATETE